MLYQFRLVDPTRNSELVCWLEHDSRLRPGVSVTLKELPDRRFTIAERYGMALERKDIKRGWNNNI